MSGFHVHVTMHRNKFLFNKTNRHTNFPNLFLSRNSTCFGQFLCPSSGVFHCIFGTGMSSNLHDINQCRMYSGKLLLMRRGTARNMQSFLTKINLGNQYVCWFYQKEICVGSFSSDLYINFFITRRTEKMRYFCSSLAIAVYLQPLNSV